VSTTDVLDAPALLTVPEACRLMRISRGKGWTMVWSGELPSIRIGRSVRISRAALDRWIADRETEARTA
jgi:excisionase family DNA binding protein